MSPPCSSLRSANTLRHSSSSGVRHDVLCECCDCVCWMLGFQGLQEMIAYSLQMYELHRCGLRSWTSWTAAMAPRIRRPGGRPRSPALWIGRPPEPATAAHSTMRSQPVTAPAVDDSSAAAVTMGTTSRRYSQAMRQHMRRRRPRSLRRRGLSPAICARTCRCDEVGLTRGLLCWGRLPLWQAYPPLDSRLDAICSAQHHLGETQHASHLHPMT